MARFVTVQTNFTTGEIDPLLRARVDLKAYDNALSEATNVICQPQGGITRRKGLRYINSLPSISDTFATGTAQTGASSTITLAAAASASNSFYSYMYVTITSGTGSGQTRQITSYVGSTKVATVSTAWTTTPNNTSVYRIYNSADLGVRLVPFEFSTSDSYMLCFMNNQMYIYKGGSLITNINGTGNSYLDTSGVSLTGTIVSKMCWTQSADTLIVVQEDLPPVKIVRGANDSSWTATAITFDSFPKYPFTIAYSNPAGTITPSAISGKITITASSAVFSAGSVGQYINVSPQGRAKIVRYTSTTVVDAITDFPFFNTSAVNSGDWEYESGYEAVWSSTRGYPRTATFHEGRLYFGGSRARPSTIWGSKVGIFLDFEGTEGLDDDSVEATLDTNTFNAITDMISGRDLQIFTTGGEFFVQQSTTEPITPTNFFVKTVSRHGSKAGVRIQPLESGTLFIQRQGKALNEFAFSDTQLTYLTNKISLLSGHLLNNPKTMALRKSVNTDENDLLMVVNSDDGTIAAYSLLRSENIIAASKWTTVGSFVDIGVDIQTIYSVVKRTISGVDQYYVERLDDNLLTDSAVTGGVSSTASVSHLVGKSVNILLDDIVQANQTVPGGGTVTFARTSTTDYEVGLPISISVKTMPADIKLQTGTRLGFKKRIVEVNALVLKTQNLVINGIEVPFRSFDTTGTLDKAIPEFTGTKVLHGILGYSTDAKLTITQSAPLKFTLLGMEYKLSVHQGT
jgi:ribosomal protein S15P/S13E